MIAKHSFFKINRQDVIAFVVLAVIWIVFFWDAFNPAYSFALFKDNEFFTGPVLSAISGAFADGEWPLRMNTALGGLPIYNFAQFSAFYPFYFSVFPLFSTPLNAAMSMHWITLLHVLLFNVNMYVLLRVMGGSRLAAITGAVLVAFGANSVSYAGWLQIVAPYAWLPLYMAGLIGVLENRNSTRYPIMAVCGIVFLALASPSQPLIHAVLVTCVLMLFRWWNNRTNKVPHETRASFFKIGVIAVFSFLLVAPAVLPVFIEFKEMIRWIGPYPPIVGHERIPFEAFLIDQLSLTELGGVLVKIANKAVGSQFIGPVAISLMLIALARRPRSWVAGAMAMIAVYALASSAGSNLGLAYVNYFLPLVNKIREPSRFLILFQLATGILAALGIDELRRLVVNKQISRNLRRQAVLVVCIVLVTLICAFGLRDQGADVKSALMVSLILVALVAVSIILARLSWRFRGVAVGLLWSAASIIVLALNVTWKPPPIAASDYLNNDMIALDMAITRVAQLDPMHNYRLVFDGSIDKQMASMLASYQNVRTLNAYFNPAPHRQFNELYYHGPRSDNYLQALGVRHLICKDCAGVEYHGFKFRESLHGYNIHEATDALPYVQLSHRLDGRFENLSDFIAKSTSFDLNQGLLFVEPGLNLPLGEKAAESSGCLVRNDIRKRNRVRYLVSCGTPSVLILNEFFADPWRATINGMDVDVLRVNGNQIGVQLIGGDQVVEFIYRPRAFILSIGLATLGVAFVLIWAIWIRRERTG